MSERVLITGAAGFIGSHLVDHLLADGATVVGVDNFDPFYEEADKLRNLRSASRSPKFVLVRQDCADLEALDSALPDEPIGVIVHLAARAGVRPSIEDPLGYAQANVLGTQAMLELARRRRIRRFIFGSSSSVYGNTPSVPFSEDDAVDRPISPYAATKRSAELLCYTYHHLFDISVHCLRFFTVYGPRQRPDLAIRKFATLMLRGEPIPMFGDGSTERDYTWIDDILKGVTASIRRTAEQPAEYQVINLGESRTTRLARLIALLGEALGIQPEIRQLPLQPGDVARTFADVSRARNLLGYAPATPVETGIPLFVQWFTDYLQDRG